MPINFCESFLTPNFMMFIEVVFQFLRFGEFFSCETEKVKLFLQLYQAQFCARLGKGDVVNYYCLLCLGHYLDCCQQFGQS